MRKIIYALAIVVIMGFLLSACNKQNEEKQGTTTITQENPVEQPVPPAESSTGTSAESGQATTSGSQEQGSAPESTQTQENPPATSGTTGTEEDVVPSDTGVTQEELDNLKKDIEGMDFEDLQGISS